MAKQELSPVEKHGPLWFKREDAAGGQKGRQLQFMVEEYLAEGWNTPGLLSASPGTSPQITFAAREARAHNIPCIIVIGVNTLESARAFGNIAIAEALGAEIVIAGASQNNWRRDRKYKAMCAEFPSYFKVPEGLGPCKTDETWLQKFYMNSAVQVMNLPEDLKHLIIPCGSGNSAVSVLLGLAAFNYEHLPENIVLAVMGHGDQGEIRKSVDSHIRRGLASSKLAQMLYDEAERISIYPKSEYGQKCRPAQEYDGIRFHPNYEAKMWKVLNEKRPDLLVEGTCIWIVGSEPRMEEFA